MEDIEKLFKDLNSLAKNKKLQRNALQWRRKIIRESLILCDCFHYLTIFEQFLRAPDRNLQKLKNQMVEWFCKKNTSEDKTNIMTIFDPLTKFIQTILQVIEFVEKSRGNDNTWWRYFFKKKETDYSYMKTCLQEIQIKIEDRKINMNRDNLEEIFPEFFDADKLAYYHTYLKSLHELCFNTSFRV